MIHRNHKPTPLVLSEAQKASLRDSKATPRPSLTTKAKNAAKAGGRIVKAAATGQRVRVSDEERDRRLAICRACKPYWDETGNVGLGECKHPGCGCTRFKHGLATETCPLNKWPVNATGG